jgi:predicted SprT family Zn-dependent metalloprotease
MDATLERLTDLVNDRFAGYVAALGGAAPHRVEFSPRITTSWALIYYRRRLVRLSPYLFLLPGEDLARGSHWRELDATLRHEAAHAVRYADNGDGGHSDAFHELLARLDVDANGTGDLGPENVAWRYVYACGSCATQWRRRTRLHGNWSCGACAPGRFDAAFRMELREELAHPWARVLEARDRVHACVREAEDSIKPRVPLRPIRA